MTKLSLAGTTAFAALFAGQMAWADVAPEDVWQNWQNQTSSVGQKVETASVTRDGDTLVVSGMKVLSTIENVTTEANYGDLRLKDLGDGTVEVLLAEEMTMSTKTAAADGIPASSVAATIRLPGTRTIASGQPDAITYTTTMPEMTMEMAITEEGRAPGKVTLRATDGAGRYLIAGPKEAMTIDGDFALGSAAMALEVAEEDGTVKGTLNAADVKMVIKGNLVGVEDGAQFQEAVAKGFDLDMSASYGAANLDFDIASAEAPGKITGTAEGGRFAFALGKAGIKFAGGERNVALILSGLGLPFPEARLSYAESGLNFAMPMIKSDQPADFTFLTKLIDLNVSEEIWAMADPMGKLPHDPATLVIDTKGKAKVNVDLGDTAGMEAAQAAGTNPMELHALDVTEIRARIAGAELTGAGAFTFDNSDLTTFSGMPVPTGKLELKLTGGNTLLDKLVEMGLLTQDDVMGYKMMISMFTNSAADKDELTSTIEAKDKHLYVNGQMMQ